MKHTVRELEGKAHQYRIRFLDIFTGLGFGHLTTAFSWAEIATVLYNEIMYLPPVGHDMKDHDKMVVSKGHGAGILFPIFEEKGYLAPGELEQTIRIGGSNRSLRELFYPGFDFYGGSLGIGLNVACGLAKGAQLHDAKWRVYCIVGDAECYEGSIWEAIHFAGHQQLQNLTVIVDRNGLGVSDFTEHMLKLEPLAAKWADSGWSVQQIGGHDIQQIYDALVKAGQEHDKPQCIIAETKKGYGLDYLVDRPLMHGYMPKGPDVERAYRELT